MSETRDNQAAPATANDCDTRRAILRAAQGRFLHYGYKKTTIDDIAQAAGVGKGTVYLHFGSKEDILLTIAREVKRNITEQMRSVAASPMTPPAEKVRRMLLTKVLAIHDACTTTAHGVELVDEMLQPKIHQCGRDEHEAQTAILAGVLRDGLTSGEFVLPEGDADQAAGHLQMAMVSFLPPYVTACHLGNAACRAGITARAEGMIAFLLHGIAARR